MKREILICVCALTLFASTTDSIYACCVDPYSDFLITPDNTVCIGTSLTFDAGDMAYDPDGTTLTYEWDFGDGETDTGEIVTHSYDEGDVYTVTLTVTDNDNDECCNSSDPNCVDREDESSQTVTVTCGEPQFKHCVIPYIHDGESGSLSTTWLDPEQFEEVLYDPDLTCWCTHYTSENNKYEHAHFPTGFDFYYDIDNDGDDETITADDCKAWYDVTYAGYTFVSAATCERNCHGYATGKSFFISGDGMNIVLEDDYIELFGEDITDATIRTKPTGGGNPLHSEKITWENGKIKETNEKHKVSPVYKMVYSPPIDPGSGWRYWKPE